MHKISTGNEVGLIQIGAHRDEHELTRIQKASSAPEC